MGIKSAPTINPDQQAGLSEVLNWLSAGLGTRPAAEPYTGQLTPDIPGEFTGAYNEFFGNQYSDISSSTIRDLISGKPAYEYDEARTARQWQESFAAPVMEAWRETVLPGLRESINQVPGNLYSRGYSDYIGQQTSDFYGQNVAPSLFAAQQRGQDYQFQSGEAAAARQPEALNIPFNQFANQANAAGLLYNYQAAPLNAAYQEFQRTDPGQYAGLLGTTATAPTIQNFLESGGGGGGGFGAIAGTLGGAFLGGPLGAAAGANLFPNIFG